MDVLMMLILATALLAAAGYFHYRLPFHTGTNTGVWMSRLVLVLTGIAVGLVSAGYYTPPTGLHRILGFIAGFGLVHVPGAAILFLKRRRARDLGRRQ